MKIRAQRRRPLPSAPRPSHQPSSRCNGVPIVAGALTAAALAFVLHSFAAAIGLAAGSTVAHMARRLDSHWWLASGLYLILAALASYGLGGYVAGRLRSSLTTPAAADEVEMRDGVHGLLVWALATLLTAVVAFATVQSVTRLAAPSAGSSGPATSVGGENIIAYDLDRLFRAERRPGRGRPHLQPRRSRPHPAHRPPAIPGSPRKIAAIWSGWWRRAPAWRRRRPNGASTA